MGADRRLRGLVVSLVGVVVCGVLAGCGAPTPRERAGDELDRLAEAPCTMMSAQRRRKLQLRQRPADSARPNACSWYSDSEPTPYLLAFEANPSRERQRAYTRNHKPTKITVEHHAVTRVTTSVANMTSCAGIVNFDDEHGFIVNVIESDPSDACVLAKAYTRSTILLVQD